MTETERAFIDSALALEAANDRPISHMAAHDRSLGLDRVYNELASRYREALTALRAERFDLASG